MKFFQHIHRLASLFDPSFDELCKAGLHVAYPYSCFEKIQKNPFSYKLAIRNPYRFAGYASDYIWVLMKTNLSRFSPVGVETGEIIRKQCAAGFDI